MHGLMDRSIRIQKCRHESSLITIYQADFSWVGSDDHKFRRICHWSPDGTHSSTKFLERLLRFSWRRTNGSNQFLLPVPHRTTSYRTAKASPLLPLPKTPHHHHTTTKLQKFGSNALKSLFPLLKSHPGIIYCREPPHQSKGSLA
jgi:hypothetical protein